MRSISSFRAEGNEFVPPSSKDFVLPPIFGENEYTTKPIFLVLLSVVSLIKSDSAFSFLEERRQSETSENKESERSIQS